MKKNCEACKRIRMLSTLVLVAVLATLVYVNQYTG